MKEIKNTSLPEDLDLIRKLLEVGLKVLNDHVKASDYVMLSKLYSSLWLAERKPEGLDTIVERFWGAAGKEDLRTIGTQ